MLQNVQGNTAYIWRQLIQFVYVSVFGFPRSQGNNTHLWDWVCCRGSLWDPCHPSNSRAKEMCLPSSSACTHCLTDSHCQLGCWAGRKRKGSSDHLPVIPTVPVSSSQPLFVTSGLGVGRELTLLWVTYCWEQMRNCAFWRKGPSFFTLKLLKFIVQVPSPALIA